MVNGCPKNHCACGVYAVNRIANLYIILEEKTIMNRRIFFAILLALGLIFLVACNGSSDTSNNTQNGDVSHQQEPEIPPATEHNNNEATIGNNTDETASAFHVTTQDTDFTYYHADFTINIAPARDDLLAAFEYLYEFDFYEGYDFYELYGMEQGDSFVIWADVPLSDLWLMTMYPDLLSDDFIYVLSSTYFTTDSLLPGQALVVRNYMGLGSFPWRGVTFFAEGSYSQHYLAVNHDHTDSPNHFAIWPIEVRIDA